MPGKLQSAEEELRSWSCAWGGLQQVNGGAAKKMQCCVMAVTERDRHIGETSVVNMVRRTRKKVLFEPGDTRQQWKGEAAASFV